MGYTAQHVNAIVENIKYSLKQQFKKYNSYSQIVNDLKYFKKGPSESICEANEWLKKVIKEVGFLYDDRQHTEWFIAMLLPHLRIPMGHQAIESQEKALEIAMKLEDAPRDDT